VPAEDRCPCRPVPGPAPYADKPRQKCSKFERRRWRWQESASARTHSTKLRQDVQICSVVPDRACEISTHSVDEDLVLVELEHDVGEPPVSAPLHAFSVARRLRLRWRRLERLDNGFRDLDIRGAQVAALEIVSMIHRPC
jgi:hypothetical protein